MFLFFLSDYSNSSLQMFFFFVIFFLKLHRDWKTGDWRDLLRGLAVFSDHLADVGRICRVAALFNHVQPPHFICSLMGVSYASLKNIYINMHFSL